MSPVPSPTPFSSASASAGSGSSSGASAGAGAGAPYVAVVGPSAGSLAEQPASGPDPAAVLAGAREVGRLLAERGAVVLCGGGTGVMGAAAEGAAGAGGVTIGLLPGPDRSEAHPALTYALPTGLGELRNGLLVRAADVVVAVGGSWGTLSEIALAVRTGRPVVSLLGWDRPGWALPDDVRRVHTPAEAVDAVLGNPHAPA